MMGLVDYDASSESEVEEDSVKVSTNTQQHQQKEAQNASSHPTLFASLPAPIKNDEVSNEVVEEEADEFLNKKADVIEKPPKRIRISVPELNDLTEDIDNEIRPLREKTKKCGLFTILPAPKIVALKNTCFVPNSLQKNTKPWKSSAPKPLKVPEAPKIKETPKVQVIRPPLSDSDSETEDNISIPITTFDEETWNNLFSKKKRIAVPKIKKPPVVEQLEQGVIELAPDAEKPYTGLDNLAFKELIGTKKKEQRINMIDIEEAKIHPDREEWLKSLTDPCFEASPEIKEPVNRTSLVKNHIMSLAERALTNDKDLQIRWAESRHSRNQTRVKYGF